MTIIQNMPQASVQQKIPIEDIKDGVIFLKGGEMRALILTTAINFALKSAAEQAALIMKFQSFLNSLDFSIQISMISRQIDLSLYLATLEQKKKEQPNELLRIQIEEYIDFIKNLTQLSRIMSQNFLVVVPLSSIEKKGGGIMEKLGIGKKTEAERQSSREELLVQLNQRVEFVKAGLEGISLKTASLKNDEIIELFYKLYNIGSPGKLIIPKT